MKIFSVLILVMMVSVPNFYTQTVGYSCNDGWILNGTKCYKILSPLDRQTAYNSCKNAFPDGAGSFVNINNQADLDKLKFLLSTKGVYGTWINVQLNPSSTDLKSGNSYVLDNNSTLPSILQSNWCSGYPCPVATYTCVVLVCPPNRNCCIGNRDCVRGFISVCERPAIASATPANTTVLPTTIVILEACQYSDGQRLSLPFRLNTSNKRLFSVTANDTVYPNKQCCAVCKQTINCSAFEMLNSTRVCTFYSSPFPISEIHNISESALLYLSGAPYSVKTSR